MKGTGPTRSDNKTKHNKFCSRRERRARNNRQDISEDEYPGECFQGIVFHHSPKPSSHHPDPEHIHERPTTNLPGLETGNQSQLTGN